MNFEVHQNGASTTLKLKQKKLDSSIAPELKGEFLLICKPKVESLVIDLGEVDFCDSSGLSALLIAERKMKEHGGKVKLLHVHKKVSSLLKISMLDRLFEIQEGSTKH
ncbi:MAG TPA: STAS domain-containing protein [Bacteroidota bacterium]|nr:STAS domain-containing protein [Bacteroidota bacterium]HXX63054.1 STAS domain-containing protein [Bacteroidota bacterium]